MEEINNNGFPFDKKEDTTSYSIGDNIDSILGLNEDFSRFESNENIILCKKALTKLISDSNYELKSGAGEIILNMLTNRPEYSKLKLENNDENILLNLRKKVEEHADWYSSVVDNLYELVNNDYTLVPASNPGWFSIKSKGDGIEEGYNFKLYTTIPVKEYTFIQHIYDLAKKLGNFAIKTNDNISVKFPYNLLGFLTHSDSIVIHFKNIENREQIEQILSDWMKDNSISEEPRNLGRTKFALDSKDTSFSNLIASNIEKWLKQNYGKYDDKILIDFAVKYAVEEGQRPPLLNGKNID